MKLDNLKKIAFSSFAFIASYGASAETYYEYDAKNTDRLMAALMLDNVTKHEDTKNFLEICHCEAAGFATKKAQIFAAEAQSEMQVTTFVKDGTEETVNTAKIGDYIVFNGDDQGSLLLNDDGSYNVYVIDQEKFYNLYEALEDQDIKNIEYNNQDMDVKKYKSKSKIYAIKVNTDFKITAPWGAEQLGKSGAYLVINVTAGGDSYIIAEDEFYKTYEWIKD